MFGLPELCIALLQGALGIGLLMGGNRMASLWRGHCFWCSERDPSGEYQARFGLRLLGWLWLAAGTSFAACVFLPVG